MSVDKYKKEDSERAEAVLETLFRALRDQVIGPAGLGWNRAEDFRDALYAHVPFLMDVFRAVRGET
jgi:hypothetical protein